MAKRLHTEKKKQYFQEYYQRNKEKVLEYGRAYYRDNKDKLKARNRRYRLSRQGLTEAEFQQKLVDQDNCCAICRRPERIVDSRAGRVRSLAVDHDHQTGKCRDLLCSYCNRAVGFLDDDLLRAESLVAYLKRHAR